MLILESTELSKVNNYYLRGPPKNRNAAEEWVNEQVHSRLQILAAVCCRARLRCSPRGRCSRAGRRTAA